MESRGGRAQGTHGKMMQGEAQARAKRTQRGRGLRYSAARYSIGKHTYKCYTPGALGTPTRYYIHYNFPIMIHIDRDSRNFEIFILTKTDSEGFHRQLSLTRDEVSALYEACEEVLL